MTTGLADYDIKQKNDWRGWAWNRVVERLPEFAARPQFDVKRMNNQDRRICSTKTVLYLCGPDDFDRRHARKLGFRDENVIAVDVNEHCIAAVRASGAMGISADLVDVVSMWPADWPIDVILADLCCGLTSTAHRLSQALFASAGVTRNTVLAVNLQRGRDPTSATLRRYVAEHALDTALAKHRGCGFVAGLIGIFDETIPCMTDAVWSAREARIHHMQIETHSYRASRVTMDSAVLRFSLSQLRSLEDAVYYEQLCTKQDGPLVHPVRRRIAALRAVRTMKLNRELSHN